MTTVDLADAGLYMTNLVGEQRRKAVVGLQVAAHLLVGTIQTQIIPSREPVPVDRGIYRAGWKVELTPDGAIIYNDSPIAGIIEHGVRAEHIKVGFKLINALAQWCIRKGLVGGKTKSDTAAAAHKKAKETVAKITTSSTTDWGASQPDQPKQPKQPKTSGGGTKRAADTITKARQIAWAIAIKARRGKGFHNQFPGGGLQIMREMNDRYTRGYVQVCVTRELER